MINNNVQELLDKKKIYYTEKGEDYLVHCIAPDHDDSHASLRIDKMTGMFHCFSCGYKSTIFQHFGEYQSKTYDLLAEVSREIDNIMVETTGLEIPLSAVQFDEDFRGIKAEVMKEFRSFTHTDPEFINRVVFPVPDITGKILGFIGRYTHSNASPKYRVVPAGAKLPIYPIPKSDHVVFVEGLFDAINLIDKGITNACSLFGTHNLSLRNAAEKLAPLQASGVVRVFMLLDSDSAGKAATEKIRTIIETTTDLVVYDISDFLEDGQDAGDLSQDEVDFLAKYIKKQLAK
jgi:DNA primase